MSGASDAADAPGLDRRVRASRLAVEAIWLTIGRFGSLYLLAAPGAAAASLVLLASALLQASELGDWMGRLPTFDGEGEATTAMLSQVLADGIAAGWCGGAVAAAMAAGAGLAARGDEQLSVAQGVSALKRSFGALAAVGAALSAVAALCATALAAVGLEAGGADASQLLRAALGLAGMFGLFGVILYATVWIGGAPVIVALERRDGPLGLDALRRAARLTAGRRLGIAAGGGTIVLGAGLVWVALMAIGSLRFDIEVADGVAGAALASAAEQFLISAPVNILFSVWLTLVILRLRLLQEGGTPKELEAVFE